MKTTFELIAQGIAGLKAAHQKGEGAKLGNLRAGGSGVLAMGKIVGACMRLGYLRSKGIDGNPADEGREHMFAGGRANEDIWAALFSSAAEQGMTIKREEEIPISWRTSNGTLVTGRPDMVLHHEGKPIRVLELKLVSSLYTAKSVALDGKPKLAHIIQAIHYGSKLGIPAEIWYASRADFHITEFLKKEIPAGLDIVEYNWKNEGKKILPFLQGYSLSVQDNGQVCYQAINRNTGELGELTHTIVTLKGLEEYFEQQSLMESTDVLPPKPSKLDADGTDQNWSLCGYCVLNDTCKSYKGTSTKEWTSLVVSSKENLMSSDKK